MLLLYLRCASGSGIHPIYLHSTMLLLYQRDKWIRPDRSVIYIPLCFYFICRVTVVSVFCICIYIPLCFYFIEAAGRPSARMGLYLHSTMLLLYRIRAANAEGWSLFTFHYASTLSWRLFLRSGTASTFTFHYASTLSVRRKDLLSLQTHLHSTMLLLYRPLRPSHILRIPHLHSTMLLLYPSKICNFGMRYLFTFHYASTLSGWAVGGCVSDFNLHSTMLLLYLRPTKIRSLYCQNLHSTMLLLYHTLRIHGEALKHHLHSTMLLLYRRTDIPDLDGPCIYIPLCFYFIKLVIPGALVFSYLHSTMLLLYHRRHL